MQDWAPLIDLDTDVRARKRLQRSIVVAASTTRSTAGREMASAMGRVRAFGVGGAADVMLLVGPIPVWDASLGVRSESVESIAGCAEVEVLELVNMTRVLRTI